MRAARNIDNTVRLISSARHNTGEAHSLANDVTVISWRQHMDTVCGPSTVVSILDLLRAIDKQSLHHRDGTVTPFALSEDSRGPRRTLTLQRQVFEYLTIGRGAALPDIVAQTITTTWTTALQAQCGDSHKDLGHKFAHCLETYHTVPVFHATSTLQQQVEGDTNIFGEFDHTLQWYAPLADDCKIALCDLGDNLAACASRRTVFVGDPCMLLAVAAQLPPDYDITLGATFDDRQHFARSATTRFTLRSPWTLHNITCGSRRPHYLTEAFCYV